MKDNLTSEFKHCDTCTDKKGCFAHGCLETAVFTSDNNWEVSQETLDASDNLKTQNAVNVSNLKGLIHD